MSAIATSASKSPGICGIHAVSRPAPSAQAMSSSIRATLRAASPRSGPIITPTRTVRARGQAEVRAGQDGQADDRDVLLERGGHDGVDPLTDAGVDDLKAGAAQRAGDDLG